MAGLDGDAPDRRAGAAWKQRGAAAAKPALAGVAAASDLVNRRAGAASDREDAMVIFGVNWHELERASRRL